MIVKTWKEFLECLLPDILPDKGEHEMTDSLKLGSDICECGHFRSQHADRCSEWRDGGYCPCEWFRFSRDADQGELETWSLHHRSRWEFEKQIEDSVR